MSIDQFCGASEGAYKDFRKRKEQKLQDIEIERKHRIRSARKLF